MYLENGGSQFFTSGAGWSVGRWMVGNHHLSHASLAFWDSPFQKALVVEYDGGGHRTMAPHRPLHADFKGAAALDHVLLYAELPFRMYLADASSTNTTADGSKRNLRGDVFKLLLASSYSTNTYMWMCRWLTEVERVPVPPKRSESGKNGDGAVVEFSVHVDYL